MGHDDLHVRKIDGHIVEVHGVAVGQSQPSPATHAAANATVSGVKDGRHLVRVDHLVDGPGHLVVGVVALHGGVKFKAANTLFTNETLGLAGAHFAFVWINAGKGDHHVAVVSGGLGNFFVGDAPTA